ncbi:MAG: phosphopantetheine adenylyltransferase [Burkholderiales bacterium]|jgi:hypothetical protein|nr:phosphopantetheine adenylyltransferase [Burkholderiales bacterium]
MYRLSMALLIVAGLIHLLPLPGLAGAAQLSRLYGVVVDDPNLAVLLRHRALLFGLLGLLLIAAAFKTEWRNLAYAAGLASTIGFLVVAATSGAYNAAIGRVVAADVVAIVCLLLAWIVDRWAR